MEYVSSRDFDRVVALINETHEPSVSNYETPREAFMEAADAYKVASVEGQPSFFLFCSIGHDCEAWMIECNRVGKISKAYQITQPGKESDKFDELEQLIRDTCYGRVDGSSEFLAYYGLEERILEDDDPDVKLWKIHNYREDAINKPDDGYVKDADGKDIIFENIYAAEYYIDELYEQQYILEHGELSRPEYKIIF